jgi:hypothetical protein
MPPGRASGDHNHGFLAALADIVIHKILAGSRTSTHHTTERWFLTATY